MEKVAAVVADTEQNGFTKVCNTKIAKLVGIHAATMLGHIKYWFESADIEILYRTNAQLSSDLHNILSESQIQRCKKKLVDAGLITISYGKGYDRTTYYTITTKAKELLGMIKEAVVEKVEKVVSVANQTKQVVEKAVKKTIEVLSPNKAVDCNGKEHKVVRGFSLSEALQALNKQEATIVPPTIETCHSDELMRQNEGFSNTTQQEQYSNLDIDLDFDILDDAEQEQEELSISEDEYFSALDAAMESLQEVNENEVCTNIQQDFNSSTSTLSIFKRIPNIDILENNRKMLEEAKFYKEDY